MTDLVGPEARKTGSAQAMTGDEYKRTAPAHKTGLSGMRPTEKDKTFDTLLTGLEKSMEFTRKAFTRYATSKGRQDEALREAFQKTLEEMIKEEAKSAVGKIPFGKVILVSIELSQAFAQGVGLALLAVNQKLEQEFDFNRFSRGPDLTTEDIELIQKMRRYQARAVSELNGILLQGLAAAADKAIQMLFAKAEATLKKAVKDVAGQIAKGLVQQHELASIFNEAVELGGEKIPEGRGKVERLAFHFVAGTYIDQLGDEGLSKRVKPILDSVKSKEPLAVGLLGGIIETIAYGSFEEYGRHVPVEQGWSELRALLLEQARGLLLQAEAGGAMVREGDAPHIEESTITIPAPLLVELRRSPTGPSEAERTRFWNREIEFGSLQKRMVAAMQAKEKLYQERIYRASEDQRSELCTQLQDRLVADRNRYLRDLEDAKKQMLREFGNEFDGMPLNVLLTLSPFPVPNLVDAPGPPPPRSRR